MRTTIAEVKKMEVHCDFEILRSVEADAALSDSLNVRQATQMGQLESGRYVMDCPQVCLVYDCADLKHLRHQRAHVRQDDGCPGRLGLHPDEESVCLLSGRDDIFLMAPVFRLYGRRD